MSEWANASSPVAVNIGVHRINLNSQLGPSIIRYVHIWEMGTNVDFVSLIQEVVAVKVDITCPQHPWVCVNSFQLRNSRVLNCTLIPPTKLNNTRMVHLAGIDHHNLVIN